MTKFLKYLLSRFKNQRGGGSPGSSTNVYTPQPTPQPSTADAVKAYTESLPAMYQAQLEYGPKLQAAELEQYTKSAPALANIANQLQMQYAPEQAAQQWGLQQQYGPLLAAQQQQLQQLYEPEAAAAKQSLGALTAGDYMSTAPVMQAGVPSYMDQFTNQDYLTNYNPEEAAGMMSAKNRLRQDIRASQAERGLGQAGQSAFDESKLMSEFELPYAQQQEQMRLSELGRRQSQAGSIAQMGIGTQESAYNRYLQELGRRQNVGLSLAGRYNVPTQSTVAQPQVNTPSMAATNLMDSYTPGGVMNYLQQGYGSYSQAARPLTTTSSKGSTGALWGLFGYGN